jgi:hypothetical protein
MRVGRLNKTLLISVAITVFVLMAGVWAASFSSNVDDSTSTLGIKQLLNFSVNNTDSSANITTVWITINSTGFQYINETNSTTAVASIFSNTSTVAVNNLTWTNTTNPYIVAFGTTEYFSFYTRLLSAPGNYSFIITTNDTSGALNSTNVYVLVNGSTSTTGNFSTDLPSIAINWSPYNITVISNAGNGTIAYIENANTEIGPRYFDSDDYVVFSYPGFDGTNRSNCLTWGTWFNVVNSTGNYENSTTIVNDTNATVFTLFPKLSCPPGYYYGRFYVREFGNPAESLTVNTGIIIPITGDNTFNITNSNAYFKGNGSGGLNTYYFMNNLSTNATSLTLTLTGLGADSDVFILNSTNTLLGRSIQKSTANEEIVHIPIPTAVDRWRVVVANAASTYTGNLFFNTINITNSTNHIQTNLDFGYLDINASSSTMNFNITNEDDRTLNNLAEASELYHLDVWNSYNTTTNFSLLVPGFATRLKVRVEWDNETGKNVSDWDLRLFDNSNNSIINSTTKAGNANSTNLVREEFVVFSGPFNSSTEGFWRIYVINQSSNGPLNLYNVTAYIYMNETAWVNTSFTNATVLNSSGQPNASRNISVNIIVPELYFLNGSYEGSLSYYNGTGWKVRLPFTFNIRAGVLLINNMYSSASSFIVHENVGLNSTKVLKFSYNNSGGAPIYYAYNTSVLTLFYGSRYINFTLTQLPPNPITAGSSGTINITYDISLTGTNKTAGLYDGWLTFNTTNSTNPNSSSYPYRIHAISLYVNLTRDINVSLNTIAPPFLENMSIAYNLSLRTQVKLLNGTIISKNGVMTLDNFNSSVRLVENNLSAYTYALTNVGAADAGGQICEAFVADFCDINGTIQANLPGGQYRAEIQVLWNTSQNVTLNGTGKNYSVVVNDTGLFLEATTTDFGIVQEGTLQYTNTTLKNYGPIGGSVTVTFDKSTCPLDSAVTTSTDCPGGSLGSSILTYTATAFDSTGCVIRWVLDVSNISTNSSTCTDASITVNRKSFNNITGITITAENIVGNGDPGNGGSPGSGSGSGCTTNDECAEGYYCTSSTCTALDCGSDEYKGKHACVKYHAQISEYKDAIRVLWGESNSTNVTVIEKTNQSRTVAINTTVNTTMNISMDKKNCFVSNGTVCKFEVTFKTVSGTEIGKHTGDFMSYFFYGDGLTETKSFTLTVLPNEEKKVEIKNNYNNLLSIVEALEKEFEALKVGGFPEANISNLSLLFNSSNSLLDQIKAAIDGDDYLTADALLKQLNATIGDIKNSIGSMTGGGFGFNLQFGDIWTWVIIGIVITAVVVIFVYVMLPPKKGYAFGKGFKIRKKRPKIFSGLFARSKGKGKKKKKEKTYKVSKYTKGYEKQKSYDYGYKKEKLSFLKKKKKKQRTLYGFMEDEEKKGETG